MRHQEGDTWNSLESSSKSGADATAQALNGRTLLQTGDGETPLRKASVQGYVKLARVLLVHGADTTTRNGETPLDKARRWDITKSFESSNAPHGQQPDANEA
jgi:ankyrin repeat protein